MFSKDRSITNLRNNLSGKIYVYLKDRNICRKFLQDAEEEGFLFGKIKPTDSDGSDIIAVGKKKQLSYVGFVGHMAFQAPSGVQGKFYRVDYEKYINGDHDFFVKQSSDFKQEIIQGKAFETVEITGKKSAEAAEYAKLHLPECKTEEEEESLYETIRNMFDVLVLEE